MLFNTGQADIPYPRRRLDGCCWRRDRGTLVPRTQQLAVHAGALAVDLIGSRAEPTEDRFGQRERHFAFTGKH
jgi:hypothetical protein